MNSKTKNMKASYHFVRSARAESTKYTMSEYARVKLLISAQKLLIGESAESFSSYTGDATSIDAIEFTWEKMMYSLQDMSYHSEWFFRSMQVYLNYPVNLARINALVQKIFDRGRDIYKVMDTLDKMKSVVETVRDTRRTDEYVITKFRRPNNLILYSLPSNSDWRSKFSAYSNLSYYAADEDEAISMFAAKMLDDGDKQSALLVLGDDCRLNGADVTQYTVASGVQVNGMTMREMVSALDAVYDGHKRAWDEKVASEKEQKENADQENSGQ